jgi:hypothetical protein
MISATRTHLQLSVSEIRRGPAAENVLEARRLQAGVGILRGLVSDLQLASDVVTCLTWLEADELARESSSGDELSSRPARRSLPPRAHLVLVLLDRLLPLAHVAAELEALQPLVRESSPPARRLRQLLSGSRLARAPDSTHSQPYDAGSISDRR